MNAQTDDAMAQLAHLREQVETLMREKAAPAMKNAADRAGAAAHDAADVVCDRADALAEAVRARPIAFLLIAAAAGLLIGRASR